MELARLLRLCFVLVWTSLASLAAVEEKTQCEMVRQAFVGQQLGSGQIVPPYSLTSSDLTVCSNSLEQGTRTCCIKLMEREYLKASEKFLKTSLQATSFYLIDRIRDSMKTYRNEVMSLIQMAENNTAILLSDIYKIPWYEHHGAIKNMFLDLYEYFKLKQVEIYPSVIQFFDQLFPLVFRYIVNDPTITVYKDDMNECLMGLRQWLHPQPFGAFPRKLARDLSRALTAAKSYLEALAVISETINATDQMRIEETCKEGITQLFYCSQCKGLVNVKPCKGFCLDVMRGCFSKVVELSREWDEVVKSLRDMTKFMTGPFGLEQVLKSVDRTVSDAIMHAMERAPEFTPMILQECRDMSSVNHQNKVGSQPQIQPTPKLSPEQASATANLYGQAHALLQQLQSSEGLYQYLPVKLCVNDSVQEELADYKCWNGSHLAQYHQTISKYHSPNIRVSFVHDNHIMVLKDRLIHVRQNIISKMSHEDMMQNDQQRQYYSSGSRSRVEDDEDFAGSGSGSGQSDKSKKTVGTDEGFVFTSEDNNKRVHQAGGSVSTSGAANTVWAHAVSVVALFLSVTGIL